MREIIFEVTETPEEGWDARVIGLSALAQGGDREDLKEMVRDAVLCDIYDPVPAPRVVRLYFVGEEAVAVRDCGEISRWGRRQAARVPLRLERHPDEGKPDDRHADHRRRSAWRDRAGAPRNSGLRRMGVGHSEMATGLSEPPIAVVGIRSSDSSDRPPKHRASGEAMTCNRVETIPV